LQTKCEAQQYGQRKKSVHEAASCPRDDFVSREMDESGIVLQAD
jgi:hypothetical protein